METSRVPHHQNIQDINQLWETDGDCVLGHAFCASVALSPSNETVNSAAYQITLKKLKRAVQRKRPQMSHKRVLLLHDNARPHTDHATASLLERWGREILEHPPYSPDLAPSGFHLFPNMKKHLRAKRFKSHDDGRF